MTLWPLTCLPPTSRPPAQLAKPANQQLLCRGLNALAQQCPRPRRPTYG